MRRIAIGTSQQRIRADISCSRTDRGDRRRREATGVPLEACWARFGPDLVIRPRTPPPQRVRDGNEDPRSSRGRATDGSRGGYRDEAPCTRCQRRCSGGGESRSAANRESDCRREPWSRFPNSGPGRPRPRRPRRTYPRVRRSRPMVQRSSISGAMTPASARGDGNNTDIGGCGRGGGRGPETVGHESMSPTSAATNQDVRHQPTVRSISPSIRWHDQQQL